MKQPAVHFPVSLPGVMHPINAVKADAGPCTWEHPNSSDEQQLLEQLRCGERAALERMIREHRPKVTRLVTRLVGWSGDETEDLVQEVFVLALRGVRRFRGGSRLGTWLTRIAINVCRSHHRKRIFRAEFWRRRKEEATEALHLDASEPSERQERIRRVTEAVRRLNGKYREVVVLHYLEGMAAQDIEQVLGISRNTVEVRLHRARKMLEEMLGPWMES